MYNSDSDFAYLLFVRLIHVLFVCYYCVNLAIWLIYINKHTYLLTYLRDKQRKTSHEQFRILISIASKIPSASNIFGISRYFSATSKARFKLYSGLSCDSQTQNLRCISIKFSTYLFLIHYSNNKQ